MDGRCVSYTLLGLFACLAIVSGYQWSPHAEVPVTEVAVSSGEDAVIDCWGRMLSVSDTYYKLTWMRESEPYEFYGQTRKDELIISENEVMKNDLAGTVSVAKVPRVRGQSRQDALYRLTVRKVNKQTAGDYYCFHTYPGSPRRKVTIVIAQANCNTGFYCKKGTDVSCLPESKVCDGNNDCDEGTDERNCEDGVTDWKRCEGRPCTCDKVTKSVACHINNLADYSFPTDMESLAIQEADLASIPAGSLSQYANLKTLMITGQAALTAITKDSFQGLSELTELGIASAGLTNIPDGAFEHLTSLRTLTLSNNALGAVTRGLFKGIRLTNFIAVNAGITSLTSDVFDDLRILQVIDLSENTFGNLDPTTFNKTRFLREVIIQDGGMTSFSPDLLRGKRNLRTVDLSDNTMPIPQTVLDSLSKVQYLTLRYNGQTFDASAFQHFTNIKKLDLKGNGLNMRKPREEFKCLDGSCYDKCGNIDADFNKPYSMMQNQETINLFGVHFDLETIEKYMPQGSHQIDGLKQINVYADTVYANQDVDKKVETHVYARNFVMKDGQTFPSWHGGAYDAKDYWSLDCSMNYVPNRSGGKMLMFFRMGAFSFYVENMRFKSGYCGVNENDLISEMNIVNRYDWLQAVTQCGQMNADNNDDIRDISLPMLTNVIAYTSAPLANTHMHGMVYEMAADIRGTLVREMTSGARLVPYLNNGAYGMILSEMYTYGKNYFDEYNNLMANKERMTTQEKSFDMILYQAQNLVTTSSSDYKTSEDMLTVSQIALGKLNENFEWAKRDMEASKREFDVAVKEHIAKESVKAVFGFVKAIVGIVTGAAAKDPAAIFDGISDLMDAITDLMDLISSVMDLMRSCNEIVNAMKTQGSGQSMDVTVYLKDLDLAADLRVQIVHWDNMVTMTNTEMDTESVREIGGSADFRRAVQEVANWGKALTNELIRQSELLAEAYGRKLKLDLATDFSKYMQIEYQDAKTKAVTSEDLVWLLKGQQFQIKISLMDYLFQYCRAYFFYQFRECESTVKPRLDDSMFNLLNRISQAKLFEVVNLKSLIGVPEPIEEQVWIEDVSGTCQGSHDCPIQFLKRQKSITVDIDRTMAGFSSLERVRIEEVEVFIDGATNSQGHDVYVVVGNTGEFKDYYRKQSYSFVSAPMELVFKYKPTNEYITRRAKVYESHKGYLTESTPFTGWVISVPDKYNPGLDLSGVRGIYMRFKGSGISYVERRRK